MLSKMKNIIWFKKEIEPHLSGFEIKYKFFENEDFGDLNQIEFNSKEMGGEVDFRSTGWLGLHLVDYIKVDELLNIFLESYQEMEKENALRKLKELLK